MDVNSTAAAVDSKGLFTSFEADDVVTAGGDDGGDGDGDGGEIVFISNGVEDSFESVSFPFPFPLTFVFVFLLAVTFALSRLVRILRCW